MTAGLRPDPLEGSDEGRKGREGKETERGTEKMKKARENPENGRKCGRPLSENPGFVRVYLT